jgi:4'-phosphopantetheinyl transferase
MISGFAVQLTPGKYSAFRQLSDRFLPSDVRSRLDSYRNESAANQHLFSYMLSVIMIHSHVGRPGREIVIRRDGSGKPFIDDASLYFNLSHSGEWLIGAVSEYEIGVDIEKIRDIDLSVARRFFSPAEVASLENMQNPDFRSEFFRIWTLKESYIKCIGKGLAHPLDSFTVPLSSWNVSPMENYFLKSYDNGYASAVCSADASVLDDFTVVDSDAASSLFLSVF